MFKFIKKIISKVTAFFGIGGNGDGGDSGGGSASKSAAGNSQGASAEQKEAKKKQWKDPNEDLKYVCHGGKVQCKYCNPPFADIIVTTETIMLQDKPWATVGDKDGKKNFGFIGVCMHPSQQKPFSPPPPCKGIISLGDWKNFSETIIGNHTALLVKSSIPCMISGEDLKIIHSGQMATLTQINPLSRKKEDDTNDENKDCGGKYCITKSNYKEKEAGKLIQEINIRLAGFGGNVPTEEFDDRTEAVIKQFQRDYMKVSETGKICGSLLRAIDEFCSNSAYEIEFDQLKCNCRQCGGWGNSKFKGEYNRAQNIERFHKYEYPGIHRSLLFALKALKYHLSKQTIYSFALISSGYRCANKGTTTNHRGKALDIQFNKTENGKTWGIRGQVYKNIVALKQIRDTFFISKIGAKDGWQVNRFGIEPIGLKSDNTKIDDGHTYSWIHIDLREFQSGKYLLDDFFVKTKESLDGEKLINIAIKAGYNELCNCLK